MQLNLGNVRIESHAFDYFLAYNKKIKVEERAMIHATSLMPSIEGHGSGIIKCQYFLEVHVDHGLATTGNKMPVIS